MERRYFPLNARDEELDELACRLFNPDNQVRIELACGGWAKVSADISPETLAALERMAALAIEQFKARVSAPEAYHE